MQYAFPAKFTAPRTGSYPICMQSWIYTFQYHAFWDSQLYVQTSLILFIQLSQKTSSISYATVYKLLSNQILCHNQYPSTAKWRYIEPNAPESELTLLLHQILTQDPG